MSEHQVLSPLPGVFYRASAPDQPPFAEVGDTVTADQTIGLVEIMKQFTPILAGVAGVLVAFVAENESTLTPGAAVATIRTEADDA